MADEADFIEQVICHQHRVYRFILSLVGNYREAEDLLQQTMMTLWQKWETRDKQAELLPWAFGIAKNHVRNHIRKQSSRGEFAGLDEGTVDRISAKQSQLSGTLDRKKEALNECVGRLNHEQRELVEQYYEGKAEVDALAVKFKKNADAIYKSLQRIRRSLFDCVNQKLSMEQRS